MRPSLDTEITRYNPSSLPFFRCRLTLVSIQISTVLSPLFIKSLVTALLTGYFKIYSSNLSLHLELENFKKTFSLNGYSQIYLNKGIRSFLDETFSPIPKE